MHTTILFSTKTNCLWSGLSLVFTTLPSSLYTFRIICIRLGSVLAVKLPPNLTDFNIVLVYYKSSAYNHNTMKAHKCLNCFKKLFGRQRKFCSKKCKLFLYHRSGLGRRRKLILLKLRGNACELCGYAKNHAALSFHHLNPKLRLISLDVRSCANRSMKALLKELKKCQLLCLNCHSEIEHPSHLLN